MKKIYLFLTFFALLSFFGSNFAAGQEPESPTTRNIVPRAPSEGSLGTEAKPWGAGWFDELHVAGAEVLPVQSGSGKELYVTDDYAMLENLNVYNAFGLDTSEKDVTLTLSAQTNFQTIVIRKFSDLHEARVVGSTTNTLTYDGQTIILDYWPQKGWYWRTF